MGEKLIFTKKNERIICYSFYSIGEKLFKGSYRIVQENMFAHLEPLYELITQLFPNASTAQTDNFVMMQHDLAVGLYPMCNLNDIQLEAMRLVNPNCITPDFEDTYQKAIYQFMYCHENGIE